jgi:hypothetical protein
MAKTVEQWKPVVELPHYQVSTLGRVRNRKGHILKGQILPGGYHVVFLYESRQCYPRYVHRLVVEAFLGPIPNDKEVDHCSHEHAKNHLSNLIVVSKHENRLRETAAGIRVYSGDGNPSRILSEKDIPVIRQRYKNGEKQVTIAKDYGVASCTISNILRGRNWSCVA